MFMNSDANLELDALSEKFVEKTFSPQLNALSEIESVCSKLQSNWIGDPSIEMDFGKSFVICGIGSHVLMHVDAINVLLRKNIAIPACLSARALVEIKYYIKWIFSEDGNESINNKIDSYLAYELRQRLSSDVYKDEHERVRALLSMSRFNKVNEYYDANPSGKKKWYSIIDSSFPNIFTIADKMECKDEYLKDYSLFSNVIHSGLSILDHVYIEPDGKMSQLSIRSPKPINPSKVIRSTFDSVSAIFEILIKNYSPSDNPEFSSKVIEWDKVVSSEVVYKYK